MNRQRIGARLLMAVLTLWAVRLAQAETYTIAGDRQIDGEAPLIEFADSGETVERTGAASPWTFDFSGLDPAAAVIDLGGYKLHCARTEGEREKIVLNLNGTDLKGTNAVSIDTTWYVNGNEGVSDELVVENVRNVELGGIEARGLDFNTQLNGWPAVTIGRSDAPANRVRIAYIDTRGIPGPTTSHSPGGEVWIWATNNVTIANSDGVLGDILTCGNHNSGAADVAIAHRGHFQVRTIDTHSPSPFGNSDARPGNIRLDGGDYSGDALIAGNLDTHQKLRRNGGRREIRIVRYRNVALAGDIVGYTESNYDADYGTDVAITNIAGDIDISGNIDLEHKVAGREGQHGWMRLSAQGVVTVAALDLDKMLYAALESGSDGKRPSIVSGEIGGFDVQDTTGNGTVSDPYISEETRLRAPAGGRIYYVYDPGANMNTALQGKVWQLKNHDGTGDGGLLMVRPPSGTVIRIQ